MKTEFGASLKISDAPGNGEDGKKCNISGEIANKEENVDFEKAISLTGYGKFNYLLMLAAIPGTCSSVFDTSVISYILPSAECDLNLSNLDKGVLNGGIYCGMISSAFLWGYLSDSLGRKNLLVVGLLIDGVLDILTSISPTFWLLFVFKFLGGFIISGPFAVMISYLAEFHAAKYRARVIMVAGIYISLANSFIPVLAWYFIPQNWSVSLWDGAFQYNSWRCFVTVCAIPSLLGGIAMCFLEESPKFLMTAGRNDEALRIFRKVYRMNTGLHPDSYPVRTLLDETKARKVDNWNCNSPVNVNKAKHKLNFIHIFWNQTKPLLTYPYLSKAVLMFSIQFFGMMAMNTVRLWLPQMFATMQEFTHIQEADPLLANLSVSFCDMLASPVASNVGNLTGDNLPCSLGALDNQTYLNSIIVGSTSTLTYIVTGYLINLIGKKKLMITGFFLAGTCGMSLFWSRSADVTLALLALYSALGGVCTSIILSVVVDVFPTNIRTMAISLTMMFGRIGSLIGNLVFPMLLDLRCELPFFLVSGMTMASSALSFLLPLTMGKALE